MKKILLVCVTSQNVITFRKGLISHLQGKGYEVSVVAFDSEYKKEIEEMGVRFYSIEDSNRSLNPLKILTLKGRYQRLIKTIAPDVVFTFMLKPNIFGVMAAKAAGVDRIFSMVEGAGDVFINNSFKWKIIRTVVCFLYRMSFKHPNKVFFLNSDDKSEFVSRRLVKDDKCLTIPGVGVDLEHFAHKPLTNHKTFLMVARMLKTKGVIEYCECARRVRQNHPDAVFNYLGAEGNISLNDIQEYIDDGSINYLGVTKDVRPFLEACSCFVLPSYREGCSMSIMEAEAAGRCIITTDSIGCKDSVEDGYNGFIVPRKNVDSLVEKCIFILDNPATLEQMSANSRTFAEENFDSTKINNKIIYEMENI